MLWGWPRIALWMAARLAPDRAHSIERVATGDLVFASNPSRGKPLDRAIAATGAATIDWMRAHGVAVSSDEVVTHVAIALRNANGDLDFIEAVPPAVRRTSARDFFREWAGGEFWHGTLAEPAVRATGERAAAAALAQLGVPYALDYSQPPAQFYCSSLAEYAYRQAQRARASGRARVFDELGFTLIFVPEQFWRDYYAALNVSLPVGAPGSNPTLLLHSPAVRFAALAPPRSRGGGPTDSDTEPPSRVSDLSSHL